MTISFFFFSESSNLHHEQVHLDSGLRKYYSSAQIKLQVHDCLYSVASPTHDDNQPSLLFPFQIKFLYESLYNQECINEKTKTSCYQYITVINA